MNRKNVALLVLSLLGPAIVGCGGDPAPGPTSEAGGAAAPESAEAPATASAFRECPPHGGFYGDVVARWLDDRRMELTEEFAYREPASGRVWYAPRGSVVDGASIPRVLWSVAGAPFTGAYRLASVVHDVGCQARIQRWEDVHRMFYEACRCAGVGRIRAKVMYAAVYHFGPRWDERGDFLAATRDELSPTEVDGFEQLVDRIEEADLELAEIEAVALR